MDRIVSNAYALLANAVPIDSAKREVTAQVIIRMTPSASDEIIAVWEHGYLSN